MHGPVEGHADGGHHDHGEGEEPGTWQVGDCLAQWWRPNFETFMYPFIPAHVTRPKECKKLYFIQLPESSMWNLPSYFVCILLTVTH